MSRSNREIVYEGWLTKSPPSKRVWRGKWRRRWFALRRSEEIPAQYFLDYYTDIGRKLKGTINLQLCDQVDAGLRMQRNCSEGPSLRGSVFSIRTRTRVYHLEADCVTEMEKWVDVICMACGMTSTEEDKFYTRGGGDNPAAASQPMPNKSGPYIAISDCITGPPNTRQDVDPSRIFLFNGQNDRSKSEGDTSRINALPYSLNCSENMLMVKHDQRSPESPRLTDNESVFVDEEVNNFPSSICHPLGTPVPPRPPKPSHLTKESIHKEIFAGPRYNEPIDVTLTISEPRDHSSQYCNVYNAPAVNRGLKPGRPRAVTSSSLDHREGSSRGMRYGHNSSTLQYLDLDLDNPTMESTSMHLRSRSAVESPTIYKTVDFLKTEALNMTRMDTEAYRRNDIPLHN